MPANGIKHEIDLLDSGMGHQMVTKAMAKTLTEDYDPIDHLNAIFSHPSTLSSVTATSEALQAYRDQLDAEIEDLDIQQSVTDAECIERIQASKAELAWLFRKIEGVRERALQTERNITEMTADIKQLDNTKKNLTLSM